MTQTQANKQLQLEKLPQVFLIQLKRFAYSAQGTTVKIDKHVTFPDVLTVPEGEKAASFLAEKKV